VPSFVLDKTAVRSVAADTSAADVVSLI